MLGMLSICANIIIVAWYCKVDLYLLLLLVIKYFHILIENENHMEQPSW